MTADPPSATDANVEAGVQQPPLPRLYTVAEAVERAKELTTCPTFRISTRRLSQLARIFGCYRVGRSIFLDDAQIGEIVRALQWKKSDEPINSGPSFLLTALERSRRTAKEKPLSEKQLMELARSLALNKRR